MTVHHGADLTASEGVRTVKGKDADRKTVEEVLHPHRMRGGGAIDEGDHRTIKDAEGPHRAKSVVLRRVEGEEDRMTAKDPGVEETPTRRTTMNLVVHLAVESNLPTMAAKKIFSSSNPRATMPRSKDGRKRPRP